MLSCGISTVFSTVWTKPGTVVAQRRARQPPQTANSAVFCTVWIMHLPGQQRACRQPPRTAPVESDTICTVLHCAYLSSVKQLENHHAVDELKLRHLHVLDEDGHRDVHASALPSICIPPWAGGKALQQSLCSAPPQRLHGHDCQDVRRVRRHFHQLFRQLRSPEQHTLRDGVHRSDRGHFDNLLVNNRQGDEEPDDFRHLFPASAAQEHREPVPHSQVRRAAPRCAAAPAPAA